MYDTSMHTQDVQRVLSKGGGQGAYMSFLCIKIIEVWKIMQDNKRERESQREKQQKKKKRRRRNVVTPHRLLTQFEIDVSIWLRDYSYNKSRYTTLYILFLGFKKIQKNI